MNDELVKRHVEQLRLTGGDLADLCQPLADAIDALTAERDEALECNEEFFVDNQFLKKRVEEAQKEWEGWQSAAVKLMKQVTALTAELSACTESPGGCGYWRERSKALTAERDRLRGALTRLLAPFGNDACHYDHHGYCQEHFIEADCCVAHARASLKGEGHE